DAHAPALCGLAVKNHRHEIEGAVTGYRQIDVGVAHCAARFSADFDPPPRGAVVAALPERRRHLPIAAHEQRAVWMLDDHGFAGEDVEMIDGIGNNKCG